MLPAAGTCAPHYGGGAGGGGTICGVQTSPPLSCIHVQPSLQSLTAFAAV